MLFLTAATASLGIEAKPFVLNGKIVDSNVQPVAGAEVAAYENFYDYSGGRIEMKLLGQGRTKEDGTIVLDLKVEKERDVCIVARKKSLAIGWEVSNRNIKIVLGKPCTLSGVVVDETGKGIAGARLRVLLLSNLIRRISITQPSLPKEWFNTVTDAEGKFVFNDIPCDAGADFFVEAEGFASTYTFMASDIYPGLRFIAGQKDIRIVLPREARIQGRVINEKGKGVSGVRLLARPNKVMGNYCCTDSILSQEDGIFCFKGLPADAYSLQVVAPFDGIAEWVGQEVKAVAIAGQTTNEVTIRVKKGIEFDVVVRDISTKQPIPDVDVIISKEGNFGRYYGFWQYTRTNSNGTARVRVLHGECKIAASGGGWAGSQQSLSVNDKTSQIEFLLEREPSVSGVVLDEKGQPVSGVTVNVLPGEGDILTDAAGKFNINWSEGHTAEHRYILAQDEERNLEALEEIKDASRPINITLKSGLTLFGLVTEPNGKAISAARVQLGASIPGWGVNIGNEVISDTTGRYEIKAVPPQQEGVQYQIEAAAEGYGNFELRGFSPENAVNNRVDLEPLVLQPANLSVSGVVADANGKPVPNSPVFLGGRLGNPPGQPSLGKFTDEKGQFSFKCCAGILRLQAGMGGNEPGWLDAKGGDTGVKVVLGQMGIHIKQTSIEGKKLPDLKELGIELSKADFNDKKVLICFWDVQQRSSRNMIKELVSKASQLQNITIVGIQASKISQDTLDEWIKQYKISFPVGMISGDEEKTRFNWGVKSLPWLILTDSKHNVVSEDFSIDELNEKLK
jgi:hypothetical protein